MIKTEKVELDKKEKTVCSFRIEVNLFKEFLKYIKATGRDSSGSKSILISDCILRFDDGKMWSIVTDDKRNLVAQIKAIISDVENPIPIPIEIAEVEKWLKPFKNSDVIEVLYENDIITLKNIKKKDFLDFDLNTDVAFSTKREDTISCDLITNLEYGDDVDKENLKRIEELGNSIYKIKEGEVELFFGSKLRASMKMSIKQLQEVISDGELIQNREYPFEFKEKKLTVTIKHADYSKKQKISRDLYAGNYNVPEPFTVTFSNRLTNAVNNIKGQIKLFADKDSPMLIKSVDSEEKGLEITYLVTTY